jgi:hypothetical protein
MAQMQTVARCHNVRSLTGECLPATPTGIGGARQPLGAAGNRILNVVPWSGSLSTVIDP